MCSFTPQRSFDRTVSILAERPPPPPPHTHTHATPARPHEQADVEMYAAVLVEWSTGRGAVYRGNRHLAVWGSDFQFTNASMWFQQMDQVPCAVLFCAHAKDSMTSHSLLSSSWTTSSPPSLVVHFLHVLSFTHIFCTALFPAFILFLLTLFVFLLLCFSFSFLSSSSVVIFLPMLAVA
jgi:hypothetical protein